MVEEIEQISPVTEEEVKRQYLQYVEEQFAEANKNGNELLGRLHAEYKTRFEQGEILPKQKKILIIDLSEGGENGQLIATASPLLNRSNCEVIDINNDDLIRRGKLPLSLKNVAAVIFSGGPPNVIDKDKQEKLYLAEVEALALQALERKIPIFGICLGLQLVEDAQGREIIENPEGTLKDSTRLSIFINSRQEELIESPILKGLPLQKDALGNMSLLMRVAVYHSYSLKTQTRKAEKDRRTVAGFEFPGEPAKAPREAYPGLIIDGNVVLVQYHPERMTEVGFWCRYTVIQSLGKEILDSKKSPEEKLEKLQAWEKRLEEFRKFYEETIEEKGIPAGLKIFQNFVSMALGPKSGKWDLNP